jgi:protein-S-isoprenylcysteine O-methyltransferase Ste14
MNRRWISPPVAFAIAAIVMWLIGRNVEFGRYSFAYQTSIGIALVVLGVLIVAWSLRLFRAAGTTPNPMQPKNATQLVTSGAYSVSRNPMYVGDVVMLAGIAVWIGSVLNVATIAIFIWYIDRFQIADEERALVDIFSDRYEAYRRRVRRWI